MFTKPDKTYVENAVGTGREAKRHAIAMISGVTYEEAEAAVEGVLRDAGIPFYEERFAPNREPVATTYNFNKEPPIKATHMRSYFPGIFLERAVVEVGPNFKRISSDNTFIIWVSFVLRYKELTRWRRTLIPYLEGAMINED